jgi:MFS family permease/HAMP domain-containing protein
VLFSSEQPKPSVVDARLGQALRLADGELWSIETEEDLVSGFTITDPQGAPVGAVAVLYPRDRLAADSRALLRESVLAALFIWAAAAAVSLAALRLMLRAPERALESLAEGRVSGAAGGLFQGEIARLAASLRGADATHAAALSALESGAPAAPAPAAPEALSGSVATKVARRLVPVAAAVIAGSALLLGGLTLRAVNRSIEPEFAARVALIGTVVSENVQRALAVGVPIHELVGAEVYFGRLLEHLPEVTHIGLRSRDGTLVETGIPVAGELVSDQPVLQQGEEVARIEIGIDPRFLRKRFGDVLLDVAVIVLVAILLAFEIILLVASRSLTAPLDRLQRLAARQAAGDFSDRLRFEGAHAVDRLGRVLTERAEALQARFAELLATGDAVVRARLAALGSRFGLAEGALLPPRIGYLTDVRLGLFLIAAADQLPLAFLPLYTRAAAGAPDWLGTDLVVSLPLAGYLLALLVASPYASGLAARLGVRRLVLFAAVPTCAAFIGLAFATTVAEIVLWRAVSGFGYALASLACIDYAVAVAGPGQRHRNLAQAWSVLFSGIFAGAALGGVLADRLGAANVFLVSAGLVVLAALLFVRLPVEAGRSSALRDGGPQAPGPLRNRRFALLVFGIAVPASIVMQGFVAYLVALSLDAIGASAADIGRTLMLYFLAIAFVGPLGGRAAEAGVSSEVLALAGQALAGAAVLAAALWPGGPAIVVAVALAGIGHGLTRGAQLAVALRLAETELAGCGTARVLGVMRGLERGLGILGLLAVAAIAGAAGYPGATAAIGALALAGAAVYAAALAAGGNRG